METVYRDGKIRAIGIWKGRSEQNMKAGRLWPAEKMGSGRTRS